MTVENEVAALIGRTNELLSVLVKMQLKEILEAELSDPKKKALYELTDGEMTVARIKAKTKISAGGISGLWQRWEQMGVVVKRNGKYWRTLD